MVMLKQLKKISLLRNRRLLHFKRRIALLGQLLWKNKLKKLRLMWVVKPYTMMEYPRLSKLYELAEETERNGIEGSIVECGVWHGGSAGMLAAISRSHKSERAIWLFDSFEGLPEPGAIDVNIHGKKGKKGAARG